jgi:uroporphyrinogen decarboxylase
VLSGEAIDTPPVWLMRQAGRYLPEYREIRRRAGSFLDLCFTPELAEEVTLQPIRRYGFDAAILFADILLVPHALGQELTFVEGEGPRLFPLVNSREALARLRPTSELSETLGAVYETIRRLKRSLPAEVALIGFAGAPWTVASYMIAGKGTPDQGPGRVWMYRDPEAFAALIERLTEATISYLDEQIMAGAEAVMLFDSWAGALPARIFERFSMAPACRIVREVGKRHPGVPVIGFPRGAGALYPTFANETGVAAVGLDTSVPLDWARRELSPLGVALQGNLDPLLLVAGGSVLGEEARRMVETMRGVPYVFNLGHGITPETDPRNVEAMLRAVRG